jgi:hypothetical protein
MNEDNNWGIKPGDYIQLKRRSTDLRLEALQEIAGELKLIRQLLEHPYEPQVTYYGQTETDDDNE